MRSEGPLAVVARRKWIVIVTVLAFTITAAIVSKSLTKVYATHSTLVIALPSDTKSFDTVQASQAIARSYADIISNPNIAAQVANRIGGDVTKKMVLDETTFEVVPDTQLLKIKAEDVKPSRAKALADGYATTFIAFAKANLVPTTGAGVSLGVPAALPGSPVRPKPTLYTLIALLFGLALGLALAFARDRFDRRVRTAEDLEGLFEPVVLARIPRRGRTDTSRFAFNEGFRILRTNLQFARPDGRALQSLALTSWQAGEGKTTATAQLAVAMAETGARVCVVESDFRRPALQQLLMPDAELARVGLSSYLVEVAELDDVLRQTSLPNISVLPAGPLPPSPSGLLEAPRGRRLVEDLLERFDMVLFDCAPLSVGAEAAVISSWCQGAVVLVDLTQATDRSVREAVRRLEAVQADLLGFVVNRDRTLEPSAYDYYTPGSATARGPEPLEPGAAELTEPAPRA